MQAFTAEECRFAEENHHIIGEYLQMRRLPENEWYDVVVFRYLNAVRNWLARPELHKWKFRTIAYQGMRSAIWNENRKQGRQIKTVSLEEIIPGTDGATYMDFVTEENLRYIYLPERRDGMKLSYNVKLPPKKNFSGGKKSDERMAIETFINSTHKNMCFCYDTVEEAKKKLSVINATRRAKKETKLYETYRVDECIYIVRLKPGKGGGDEN